MVEIHVGELEWLQWIVHLRENLRRRLLERIDALREAFGDLLFFVNFDRLTKKLLRLPEWLLQGLSSVGVTVTSRITLPFLTLSLVEKQVRHVGTGRVYL
jgi:hypothetical protein